MTLTRISITIPESLVRQADVRARALDRSRSWLIVEALRRYLHEPGASAVAEHVRHPFTGGIGPQRRAQLEADLRLTPEERVKEAERTAQVGALVRPLPRRDRVLTFDSYEDYLDWSRRESLG